MKTLLTADWHLSENPRDAYRFEFLNWLADTIQRQSVDHLIILGDLTESKDMHSAWLTNAIADDINALASLCKVTILQGNHDALITENPFFEFVRHVPNIQWIGKPTKIGKALFLPHTRNYKKDWKEVKYEGVDVVYAHNTFSGTKIRDQELDGIPNDLFPEAIDVWSGDIHVPQRIGNIEYVGAPYTINFGDSYQGRIVFLDEPGTQSIKYNGPQKRLIEVPHISSLTKYAHAANEHDIVRIKIKLDQKSQERWEEIRNEIKAWVEEHAFVLDSIQPIIEHRIPKSYKQIDKQSDEDLVRAFSARAQVPPSTLKTGLKFL